MKKYIIILFLFVIINLLICDYHFLGKIEMNEIVVDNKEDDLKLDIKENKDSINVVKNIEKKTEEFKVDEISDENNQVINNNSELVIKDILIERKQEEYIKFGTGIIKNIISKTYIYEDGTTKTNENVYYTYDKHKYNASLDELVTSAQDLIINNKSIIEELINKVNNIRTNLGIGSLNYDYNLSIAATIRAIEMAYSGVVDHIRPNHEKWNNILDELNIKYKYAGENIGSNVENVDKMLSLWVESQGHYNNIINKNYQKIGIGYISLNGEKYWVQLFSS